MLDGEEDLSEVETQLREEEARGEKKEIYVLSEEAEEAILEKLWDRVSDHNIRIEQSLRELGSDLGKLSALVTRKIRMQDDANRLLDDLETVGKHNRENTMKTHNQEEGTLKGFNVKKAVTYGTALLAAVGAGYGLGHWHANRSQRKAQEQKTAN